MLVAAEIDFIADDRWRRVKRFVERVDCKHLELWSTLEDRGRPLLTQQVDPIRRTDRRCAEITHAWQTLFEIVSLSVGCAQTRKKA